ncbi:MAG: transposase [Kineosporiaceae bacterium]
MRRCWSGSTPYASRPAAWPAVLEAAAQPLKSATWRAGLEVVLSRAGGDLARVRRLGPARCEAAVRKHLPRWGRSRPCLRIVRAVYAALSDPTGVRAVRPGVLERVHLVLDDWRHTTSRLAQTESRMVAVLDELDLTDLACGIQGLSAVGAAAILAETGDPTRFATPRALVKHAGLTPRERASGAYTGKTRIGRVGRPAPRLAAWRAAWVISRSNPVYAARFTHLTTGEANRLSAGQARAAIAGALLRQLHVVVTRRQTWDPDIAAAGRTACTAPEQRPPPPESIGQARPVTDRGRPSTRRAGQAPRGIEANDLVDHHGRPRPSPRATRLRAVGTNPITAMQGSGDGQAPAAT